MRSNRAASTPPAGNQTVTRASSSEFAFACAIGGVAGAGAGKLTGIDGEAPKRATVQVWDSMETYKAYRNSAEFKEVRKIGNKYAKFRTFTVEGLPK